MILGGSMARVGALSECPFQGEESIHTAGNGDSTANWPPSPQMSLSYSLLLPTSSTSVSVPNIEAPQEVPQTGLQRGGQTTGKD